MKNHLNLVLLINSLLVSVAYADISDLHIENAWIAEAPPVSKVMVGYMKLTNKGSEAIVIKQAKSDLYSSIELHETLHQDGMASMIRYESIDIPANSHIELKPGGKHLMMFNPVKTLHAGDTVNIKFVTNNNKEKSFPVKVKKSQQ